MDILIVRNMVRNYEKRTNKGADRGNYSKDSLTKAVEDVKNGNKTVYGASVFYGVPRSTLRRNKGKVYNSARRKRGRR
jgi:hypothetical protein